MEPVFFATAAELRAWFEKHHEDEPELLLGYDKKHTGRATVTHVEAIEQALCFGWIDSVGRRLDDDRYQVRFSATGRQPASRARRQHGSGSRRSRRAIAAPRCTGWSGRSGRTPGSGASPSSSPTPRPAARSRR